MANAEIQTIGGKQVLVLNQTSGSGTVNVNLAKGEPVQGQDYFAGEMTWEGQPVDVIDSQFSNDSGNAGDIGPVTAAITLIDAGNEYSNAAPASSNPNGSGELEYISQVVSNENKTLTLTYTEPPVNTDTGQIEMFFQTSDGVIDPASDVDREPR